MNMSKTGRLFALAAFALASTTVARAGEPDNITPEELALLPPYCSVTQMAQGSRAQQEYRRLLGVYGRGFSHMHHYCWGLVYRMRMYKMPGRQRGLYKYQGKLAVDEIDYVLRATNEDKRFAFRPELLETRARILVDLSDLKGAAKTAEQLILEWPELPRGYIILADILASSGNHSQAAAVLAKGEEAVADKAEFSRLRQSIKIQ